MLSYIWPIALIVASNTFYHICTSTMPVDTNPFFALMFTYLTGAFVAAVMYFVLRGGGSIAVQFRSLNFAPFVLGASIVGLEAGFIYAYKVGWPVSSAQVVASSALAVVLIGVGALLFKEKITLTKLVGLVICMVGLYFINK